MKDAGLRGANLIYADLRYADFDRSDLSDIDGREAIFFDCSFAETSLERARVEGAHFRAAIFYAAALDNANLAWSELDRTFFVRVSFRGVNLAHADFRASVLANCDLSGAAGLEQVVPGWPGDIGISTLVRTLDGQGGHFTAEQRVFSQQAGVPSTLLEYLPSLLESHPIQFFSCFVSYADADEPFADKLYRDLRARNVRCWKYSHDAIVGRGVWDNIDRAIAGHEKIIIICSRSSLTRPGVLRELERALQLEDRMIRGQALEEEARDTDILVPIRIDDYLFDGWDHPRRADVLSKHVGDFRNWQNRRDYDRAFMQLLRSIDPNARLGLSN